MSEVRVVVSGIGLLTGLGPTRETTWSALKQGLCAVQPLSIPAGGDAPPFWGCPSPVVVSPGREPVLDLLDIVVDEAIADARILESKPDPERLGVLIGSSKGGIRSLSRLHGLVRDRNASEREIADVWHSASPGAGASRIAARLDARGPCLAPVAACATGLVAVLQGSDLIRRGVCEVVIAGSVDAALEPILLRAFRTMRVLAPSIGEPHEAIRPWDRRRRGFLVGEGGAVLILEREDRARSRGIVPYAEIAGGAISADAHHETALNPDPAGLAYVLTSSLANAKMSSREINFINLHGTATPTNDVLECRAIRQAFGVLADGISCSASKGQIGHLLGAAGSAELALTCLAMRDGFVPPTVNLTDPDPSCDLDATPLVGRARTIDAALKLSIGFGGHLVAAVLHRFGPGPFRKGREANRA